MPSIIIKEKAIKVDVNMKNYNNESSFVKKAEKATAFLKKYGLPKQIKKGK